MLTFYVVTIKITMKLICRRLIDGLPKMGVKEKERKEDEKMNKKYEMNERTWTFGTLNNKLTFNTNSSFGEIPFNILTWTISRCFSGGRMDESMKCFYE